MVIRPLSLSLTFGICLLGSHHIAYANSSSDIGNSSIDTTSTLTPSSDRNTSLNQEPDKTLHSPPAKWEVYAGDIQHDSDFSPTPGTHLAASSQGFNWSFAEADALPLSIPDGKDESALGARSAPVKTTQFLGSAVGVSVVGDTVYAESDEGYVYALDAETGKQIWATHVDNAAMGDPIVVDGRVFVGTGDTGFSFAQVLRSEQHATNLIRGLAWGAVYALDSRSGKVLWRYGTKGENMPSECYAQNTLYFGNGDGHVYALEPATGSLKWKTSVGGFDSMSSCNVYGGRVYAGFTDPNDLVALDLTSGKLDWTATFPNVANTGMGDNSPTIDLHDNEVIQVAVAAAREDHGRATVDTAVLGVDAGSGHVKWKTLLGRGASPPAYKASVAMVHRGIIYVSSPATNTLYAIKGNDGTIIWRSSIPHPEVPGLGRGAVTFDDGKLYQATGAYLYEWDAQTGRLINSRYVGGRFGIDNPVIVGPTMYLSNSWGWIIAVPIAQLSSQPSNASNPPT